MTNDAPRVKLPRRRLTAAWLAIGLGCVGVHKFYLGQVLWGAVYLILAGTGIPLFLGIVDGVILLLMSDEHFDEKHNTPKLLEKKHPKVTAITLAVVAGGFGAHKFYLRQTVAGLIYLTGTLFGLYLFWQGLKDAGILDTFYQLSQADRLEALEQLDHLQLGGLFLPSVLMLIPTLGGLMDAVAIGLTKREVWQAKYGTHDSNGATN